MLLKILIDLALFERNANVPLFLKLREFVPDHITTRQLINYIVTTYLDKPQFRVHQSWSASIDEFQLPLDCIISQVIKPTDIIRLFPCLGRTIFSDIFSYPVNLQNNSVGVNCLENKPQNVHDLNFELPAERKVTDMVQGGILREDNVGQVTVEEVSEEKVNSTTSISNKLPLGIESEKRRYSHSSGPEISKIFRQKELLQDIDLPNQIPTSSQNITSPQYSAQLLVPPGKGSKSTQSRNARRRANRRLAKLDALQEQQQKQNERNLSEVWFELGNDLAKEKMSIDADKYRATDTTKDKLNRSEEKIKPTGSYKRKLILTSYECDSSYNFRNGTVDIPPFPFEYHKPLSVKGNINKRKKPNYNDLEAVSFASPDISINSSEGPVTKAGELSFTSNSDLDNNRGINTTCSSSKLEYSSDSKKGSKSGSSSDSEPGSDFSSESSSDFDSGATDVYAEEK